jgi:hypothetical protein
VYTSSLKRRTDAKDVPRPHQRRRQTPAPCMTTTIFTPRAACTVENHERIMMNTNYTSSRKAGWTNKKKLRKATKKINSNYSSTKKNSLCSSLFVHDFPPCTRRAAYKLLSLCVAFFAGGATKKNYERRQRKSQISRSATWTRALPHHVTSTSKGCQRQDIPEFA